MLNELWSNGGAWLASTRRGEDVCLRGQETFDPSGAVSLAGEDGDARGQRLFCACRFSAVVFVNLVRHFNSGNGEGLERGGASDTGFSTGLSW